MSATRHLDLGGITLSLVSGGINQIDGGGMLGIVPKTLWGQWYPADEENRITLDTNCLVVESKGGTILIETGCGNKLTPMERRFYGGSESDWLLPNLLAAGFNPSAVERVVVTHLHTDHVGGAVMADSEGRVFPTFPNADLVVGVREFEDAEAGRGITPNAYVPTNYRPFVEMGRLERLPPETEIVPGVRFLDTPGHTYGHQSVLIEGSSRAAVFTGDVLALRHHAPAHYSMAYDVEPVRKGETKRNLLERARREDWILILSHEPQVPICRAVYQESRNRYDLEEYTE